MALSVGLITVSSALRSSIGIRPPARKQKPQRRLTSTAWAEEQTCPALCGLILHRSQTVQLCRFKAARSPTSADLQPTWTLQRSQLQKRLRKMENTWWLSKANEMQNYVDANMAHQFYEAIKVVYGPRSDSMHPVCTKDGITLIKDKKDILSR